jgi:hypothetical protein
MALYNDVAGKPIKKVFNRIGIRRSLNLSDLSSTSNSLSNLLNGLGLSGDNTFIADDLNAIKNIFANGLTNEGYLNVVNSASRFVTLDGTDKFFDPKITYQNRLDQIEVFSGNPRLSGGNGLTANYYQNDQILVDEHANFEYNITNVNDSGVAGGEVYGGATADGQIPPDNFWEEGDFEYSAKVHPQSSKINTGVKWEGYFVPVVTGPVKFSIISTGYFTMDFNRDGYLENDNKVGTGDTYTEYIRVGVSTEFKMSANITSNSNALIVDSSNLERMNTIGIGMTAVHSNIATGSKVESFDKLTGVISLIPPDGSANSITASFTDQDVGFTRSLGEQISHNIETHVLEAYKKYRIRLRYFHHKNFDSKDIERMFDINVRERNQPVFNDLRYNRLFSLDYDFSNSVKGSFNKYYDNSVLFGGTGAEDNFAIGSRTNSNKYVRLSTSDKVDIRYTPFQNLNEITRKTFQVQDESQRNDGSKGVIVTADSPILNLRDSSFTQNVEVGNLIVSTQATGDVEGGHGQGFQGNGGEPSIPFFARVKDFVLNSYIVMDLPALPATGANAGIGVTNAATVKIIDHRGLVKRVRVNSSSTDEIFSASSTNPFTGTQSANSSSGTIHKDIQKGMIAIGQGIDSYTVVDEVISKTQLKLSASVNVTQGQDVFFYDFKGLRDNTLLKYCDRFNSTPQVRCLTAKVKDAEGNPLPGGLPVDPPTTSFEVEDANGVASTGWTLQGIYFGDSGTAVTGVVEVGTASTTITIASGIKAPLPDGARFTATTESTDRTLCCPPTDTSPPFRATAEGLNTVESEYENLKIDSGNLVFDSLTLQDDSGNASVVGNDKSVNRTIEIKTPLSTSTRKFKILAKNPTS